MPLNKEPNPKNYELTNVRNVINQIYILSINR